MAQLSEKMFIFDDMIARRCILQLQEQAEYNLDGVSMSDAKKYNDFLYKCLK